MKPTKVEIEAPTLDLAREQLRAQRPEGHHIVREEVLDEGGEFHVFGSSYESSIEAIAFAEAKVPPGAQVIKREIHDVEYQHTTICAFDDETAQSIAAITIRNNYSFRSSSRVKSVTLVKQGTNGFLGFGRKPGTYDVRAIAPAVAQLTFRRSARIRALLATTPPKQKYRVGRSNSSFNAWASMSRALEPVVNDTHDVQSLIKPLTPVQDAEINCRNGVEPSGGVWCG